MTETESNLLLTIAELAVGFAGFAGLTAIVAQAFSGNRLAWEAHRLRSMLMVSLIAAAYSLLPHVVHVARKETGDVWQPSAAVFLAGWIVYFTRTQMRIRRLTAAGVPFPRAIMRFNMSLHWVAAGLLAGTGLGWVRDFAPTAYVLALGIFLYFAAYMYARVVSSVVDELQGQLRPRDGADDSPTPE